MKKAIRIILILNIIALMFVIIDKFNYSNCKEAFKKGHTNIKRGSIFYKKFLDRDNDGVACEI